MTAQGLINDRTLCVATRLADSVTFPEFVLNVKRKAIAATRACLAELDAQDDEVIARKVSVKARVALLSESQAERDQLETQLAFLASRSRQAALLDGVTANPPGRISFDRHAEIGSRLKAMPVLDLYDLTEAMLSVVIHPLPGPRKGRLPSSEIVRRIEIDGVRLGEDDDPYEE